jgi:uncharacterized protein (TIGR01319 family)
MQESPQHRPRHSAQHSTQLPSTHSSQLSSRQPFDAHIRRFCITDVGSTTTKAFLFERGRGEDRRWSFRHREAPTTVERPHEDVTVGVRTALGAIAQDCGVDLLADGAPGLPYLSTSSAGGGLAMVVTGLVREVTSRSAERVALGAGAILLDVIAMDDGRTPYEKIEALRRLRPDMVLLAGGFDGDALSGPVFLAELIREAGLRPKLTAAGRLPVVYAGNRNACDYVRDVLDERFHLYPVANIRPANHVEQLEPARMAIHDLFMDHVMSQAPGYEQLLEWVSAPVMPTPSAFGRMLAIASRALRKRILAIDIGGATTDVFTAKDGEVFRTVSANLGMSYSILNVIQQAGPRAVLEMLHREFEGRAIGERELIDRVGNKHLRPTSLPDGRREIQVEQAVAAVAIREAVREHVSILTGETLSRSKSELGFQNSFEILLGKKQEQARESGPPKLAGCDLVIGSGGILSHSPRDQAAKILVAALEPGNKVELALDSAFMFPHLGILSTLAEDLALELFTTLGLVRLGRAGDLRRGQVQKEAGRRAEPGGSATPAASATPAVRVNRDDSFDIVQTGEHRERRELASAGECYVSAGERVSGDHVVARSTRTFQRPFFLPMAGALRAAPEEMADCLLKEVGDSIEAGELIGKRRMRFMRSKEYRSPVAGTFERILPDGTLVVREHPDSATERVAVSAAQDLQVRAGQLGAHLKIESDQKVEQGQVLAAKGRPGMDLRTSTSPVRGRVTDINLEYGIVTIEPLREELDVRAWIPGEVAEVTDRGCTIRCRALCVTGSWGRGGECRGRLCLGDPSPDSIVVRDHVTREQLLLLEERRAAGLIAGSLSLSDVSEVDPSYSLLVAVGFGEAPLPEIVRASLEPHDGQEAFLDGTTELRVGVRRPRLILPM